MSLHPCTATGCSRQFLDRATLQDHADAVHTFDDIRQVVAEAVREQFGSRGVATNGDPRVYVWVSDIADDWCVFELEVTGGDSSLQKVSYSIVDGVVSLGTPVEVTRRTVYEPVAQAAG